MGRITFITSRILCALGVLTIFSALVDHLNLVLPPEPDSVQWRLTVFIQLVDRGSVPFVGITFLLAGSWVGELRSRRQATRLPKMRLLSLICACLLSLMFFFLLPLLRINLRAMQEAQINAIELRANQEEENLSLKDALPEQIQRERSRIEQQRQEGIRGVESSIRQTTIRVTLQNLRLVFAYAVLGGLSLVNPDIFKSQGR